MVITRTKIEIEGHNKGLGLDWVDLRLIFEATESSRGERLCGDVEGKSWQSHNPENPGSDKSLPEAETPACGNVES